MRYLLFVFCGLFLMTACGTYHYPEASGIRSANVKELNSYYNDTAIAPRYKTSIRAFGQQFQGILSLKTNGPDAHRVHFVDNVGKTIFDISILPASYVTHEAINPWNKKSMNRELAAIFRTLTQRRFATSALIFSGKQHFPVYVVDDCYYLLQEREVSHILQVHRAKEWFGIDYEGFEGGLPRQIKIEHRKLPIVLDLQLF